MTDVMDEFRWRGLVYDYSEGLPETLARDKVSAYIGFDPSSDSLQVGNLLVLTQLARMQRFGHSPIALAGGGTGMIGDPSGKKSERALLSREEVEANVEAIKPQLARYLDFDAKANPARLLNNAEWLNKISMMDFLRDIGKHFTVNYMLAKDSVKTRIDRQEGMSYTEFSYMLLQAYDFLELNDRFGCAVQAGGSDQWGNITAGVELIRRARGERAYGLVFPLITTADGSKLGKTAEGTIWLDPDKTSPFRFYQYWLNTSDADVIPYLQYFTWLSREEIEALARIVETRPEAREAQRTLAGEMTRIVHGDEALVQAEKASEVLFGGDIAGLTGADIAEIFADVPASDLPLSVLSGEGKQLTELMAEAGLAKSKGEARRLIASGGAYVNNSRISDPAYVLTPAEVLDGRFLVLRSGKKQYHLIRLLR